MSRKKLYIHTPIRYAFHCILTSKKENCKKVRLHATYSLHIWLCIFVLFSMPSSSFSFPPFFSSPSHAFFSPSPFPFSPLFLLYATPPHHPLSLQHPTHLYSQVRNGSGGGGVGGDTQIHFFFTNTFLKYLRCTENHCKLMAILFNKYTILLLNHKDVSLILNE